MWRFWGFRGMRFNVSKDLMFLLITLLVLLQPLFAEAAPQVKITDPAFICSQATRNMEKKHHIKQHLLTTISSIESGRWNEKAQQTLAWPWTINAQGKGYFFDTKADAIKKVRELQSQGITSIDVGCMQVNLLYHGHEFANLEQAFDPVHNVEYAAKFLRNLYKANDHDWLKAAMSYHSSLPEKANVYRKKIVAAFEKVKVGHRRLELTDHPKGNTSLARNMKKPLRLKSNKNHLVVADSKLPKQDDKPLPEKKQRCDVQAWREAKLEEYRVQKMLARHY